MRVVEREHSLSGWWESQTEGARTRLAECLALAVLLVTVVAAMVVLINAG